MKKILLSSEWVFVSLISLFLVIIGFIPYFHEIALTPKDNIFLGTHNNALDYPMFISEILQSERGRWTVLAKFTSEAQPGTLVHPIYIPIGKVGALLHLSAPVMYEIARALFGFTLSLAIYYFIQQIFVKKSYRRLAFLLTLFSAGFTKIDWTLLRDEVSQILSQPAKVFTGPYLSWWTGGDVIRRAVFQPHAMVKNTLLLLILVWMGKLLTKGNKKYLFFAIPAGILLGLLDPMNTLTILALLVSYGLYKFVINNSVISFLFSVFRFKLTSFQSISQKPMDRQLTNPYPTTDNRKPITDKSIYLLLITYALPALAALFYTNWVFENTPWKVVKDWEALQFYPVNFWEYGNHIGITFYLGALGLLLMIINKKRWNIFTFYLLTLTLIPVFLITSGITQFLHLSTLRFFQTPVYVFLAITTTYLLTLIFNAVPKKLFFPLILTSCFIILTPSFPTYYLSFRDQWSEFKPWYWNIYPDKNFASAMEWLKENTPVDSVVLSNSLAGNIIPAMSGNSVYVGHMVSTINYEQKKSLSDRFLGGTMTAEEARQVLHDGRVNYLVLIWGEQSRVGSQNYPFLQKVYENPGTMIYRVIK